MIGYTLHVEFVLQDVEVCGKKTFKITPSSIEPLEWEEYGLKVYPQKDCLPPGVDKVSVDILASIAGQYVFPEDCYLISSVFWLRCQPNRTFAKPIKLQMEHCANTNDLTNLTFVRASTSSIPYSFKQIEGGQFFIGKNHRDHGTIELSQFCGVAMCQMRSNDRKYCAYLYFLGQQNIPDDIHIALTCNEPGHVEVSLHNYTGLLMCPYMTLYRNSRRNTKMIERRLIKSSHLSLSQIPSPWTFQLRVKVSMDPDGNLSHSYTLRL